MSLQTWTHNSQKVSSLPPSWPTFKWDPSSPDPIYFQLKWSLCFLRRCSWALLTIAGRCKMILPLWCRRWLTRLRHFGNARRWLLYNALSQLLNNDHVEKWGKYQYPISRPWLGLLLPNPRSLLRIPPRLWGHCSRGVCFWHICELNGFFQHRHLQPVQLMRIRPYALVKIFTFEYMRYLTWIAFVFLGHYFWNV